MAQVTITINSREYAVACEDGQEVRILQLARLLDEKAKMITAGAGQENRICPNRLKSSLWITRDSLNWMRLWPKK